MRIDVETLGSVTVRVDGKPAASLLTKPIRSAAFLYVILEPHPTRELLIDLFWSDRDPERARRACTQMMYQLRQDLGGEWLVAVGNRLEVHAEVHTDVQAFERALKAGRNEEALALYRGPFLADLGKLGGIGFEQWSDRIRARLEREHRKARRAAIAAALEEGDLNGALVYTREWVEIDPLDDEANHRRIELLGRSGARDDALRCFALYDERVRRELGVEPMEQTVQLIESIRTATMPDAVSPLAVAMTARDPAPQARQGPPRPAAHAADARGRTTRDPARGRFAIGAAMIAALLVLLYQPWSRPQSAMVVVPGDLSPAVIAILPFENWSEERELEVIANGLRETLALELHGNDRLAVVSNPAVRIAHEAGVSHDTIAARFNAGTMITGSIQRVAGAVRVHLGVTDARGADAYVPARVERPDSQVHLLEADLLEVMSGILRERLGQRIELARTLPASLTRQAYTAYEEGRLLLQEARESDRAGAAVETTHGLLRRAHQRLDDAAAGAPDWVAPVVLQGFVEREVARVHGTRDTVRYMLHMERAEAAANRALAIEEASAEALELRGMVRMHLGMVAGDTARLRRAEQDLVDSAARDARRASTWRTLSTIRLHGGDLELAVEYAARALAEDPFDLASADLIDNLILTFRSAAQAAEANLWCQRGLIEHPRDYRFTECILANAAVLGDPVISADSAARLARSADLLDPPPAGSDPKYKPLYRQVLYATVLVRQGEAERADRVMESAVRRAREQELERYLDYDRAFYTLLTGDTVRARDVFTRYVRNNPNFRAFASRDPRWPPAFHAPKR